MESSKRTRYQGPPLRIIGLVVSTLLTLLALLAMLIGKL